jgi:hypothetical protein
VKIDDMHPEDGEVIWCYFLLEVPWRTRNVVFVFNKKLYQNLVPDNPVVERINPWGEHKYIDNIEDREDGGTPVFFR